MSIIDTLTNTASRLADEVQHSLRRARLEGERRVLQRQQRSGFEDLGRRVVDLVRQGRLPGDEFGPELATVEAKQMEIDARTAEIDALRDHDDDAPSGGPGWDAAERFFPKG